MFLALDATSADQTRRGLIRLDPAYALAAQIAERHLLGYLMLNGEAWRVVANIIDPGDFEGYPHCRIYLAMEALAGLGEPIDILALCEFLEADEHYQAAGGIQLLGQLATETPIHFEQVSGLGSPTQRLWRITLQPQRELSGPTPVMQPAGSQTLWALAR